MEEQTRLAKEQVEALMEDRRIKTEEAQAQRQRDQELIAALTEKCVFLISKHLWLFLFFYFTCFYPNRLDTHDFNLSFDASGSSRLRICYTKAQETSYSLSLTLGLRRKAGWWKKIGC